MPECPTSIEELQELEKLIPLCRVTLYNQAKARIETGAAKSVSEAARQLADETGRSPATIRTAIQREENRTASLTQLSGTDKHRPNTTLEDKQPYASSNLTTIEDTNEPEYEEYDAHDVIEEPKPPYNHRALGTGENEWYTPPEYIDAAVKVLGEIDLDPASSEHAQKTISAKSFFTVSDDGLTKEWFGNVWMNPPYTQPDIKNFIKKLVDEYNSGNVTQAIALTHNYTDTSWFHIAAASASAICLTRGRIAFVNQEGKKAAPTQGQAFFYYGENKEIFESVFSDYGIVLTRPNAVHR